MIEFFLGMIFMALCWIIALACNDWDIDSLLFEEAKNEKRRTFKRVR